MRRNTWVSLMATVVMAMSTGSASAHRAMTGAHRVGPGAPAAPLGSAFIYQGSLKQDGAPVQGACDANFALYDADVGGTLIGGPLAATIAVTAGLFTTPLDFGNVFNSDERWLEIEVRCPDGVGAFTTLAPRQPLSAVPVAAYSLAPWSTNGTSVSYVAGRVGVGVSSPEAAFNVNGTSWFQGDSTPLSAAAGQGIAIGYGGNQGYVFGFDYATFTPRSLLLQHPGGNVGVGTLFPTAGRLHVDGGAGPAVYGTSTSGVGVYGVSGSNAAVYGYSNSDYGVDGRSFSTVGIYGQSYSSAGMWAVGPYIGIQGNSTGGDANRQAVRGDNAGSATGYAGLFYGNTWVVGTLYKNGGAFRIDHPLDPANKYLSHSFVESPDMKNIYDGVVTTDGVGLATIELPAWFEALNGDFRYQLTSIGQFAQAIVLKEIKNNRFTIQTDKPRVKVSWQVTGIRHDPYAEEHRILVEQDKPAADKGLYVYPAGYNQPASRSIAAQTGGMPAAAPERDPQTNHSGR